MILVDTSVWVDLLGPKPRFVVPVEKMPLLAICPPIVQEIMQGVSHAKVRMIELRIIFY
jgi:predicted nucleic acid-binding protein